jgi:hypothetical protein
MGVLSWTNEGGPGSPRVNVDASGFMTVGAPLDTFPALGMRRLSGTVVNDGFFFDLDTWHPDARGDVPIIRTLAGGGVAQLFFGGDVNDSSKIVDNNFQMGLESISRTRVACAGTSTTPASKTASRSSISATRSTLSTRIHW